MNAIHDVFEQSTDAVFGINAAGRIRFCNSMFAQLLGYSRGQLCGMQCAEVLCGTDIQGHAFCGKHCPIPKTVDDDTPVCDFDLVIKDTGGDSILVNIGACYTHQSIRDRAGDVDVFFCLRRINPQRLLQRMATTSTGGSLRSGMHGRGKLTSREQEIIGLAASGLQTAQIADRLCVSVQTVRTHFRNIYPKLGVNSRTEAVIFAMQHGLH